MAINCPRCGNAVEPGKRFCLSCGMALRECPGIPCCQTCGAAARSQDRFCLVCGGKVALKPEAAAPRSAAQTFCRQCGAHLAVGTKFCTACGAGTQIHAGPVAVPAPVLAVPSSPVQVSAPVATVVEPAPVAAPPPLSKPTVIVAAPGTVAPPELPVVPATHSPPAVVVAPAPAGPQAVSAPGIKPVVVGAAHAAVPAVPSPAMPSSPPAKPVVPRAADAPPPPTAVAVPRPTAFAVPVHGPGKSIGKAAVVLGLAAMFFMAALAGVVMWARSGGTPPPGPSVPSDQTNGSAVAIGHIPVKIKPEPPAPQLTEDLRNAILTSPALAVQVDSADPTQKAFAPTGKMTLLESSATREGWKEFRVKCEVIRRNLNRESTENILVVATVDLSGKLSSVKSLGAHDDQWDALVKK